MAAPPPRNPNAANKSSGRGFTDRRLGLVLIVFAVLWLIPSLWAIKTSLTPNDVSALGAGPILKDWQLTLDSYVTILTGGDIWNWYLASAITSVVTVVLTVFFASMAAYAISRLPLPRPHGSSSLLMIGGIMIPPQVLIVPIFQELNAVGLLNTYWAVILPQVPAVIAVFVFKQFFDGLPRGLRGGGSHRRRRLLDDLPDDRHAAVAAGASRRWRSSPSSGSGTT